MHFIAISHHHIIPFVIHEVHETRRKKTPFKCQPLFHLQKRSKCQAIWCVSVTTPGTRNRMKRVGMSSKRTAVRRQTDKGAQRALRTFSTQGRGERATSRHLPSHRRAVFCISLPPLCSVLAAASPPPTLKGDYIFRGRGLPAAEVRLRLKGLKRVKCAPPSLPREGEGCQHSFFFLQSAAAASLSGHAACNECSAERLSIAEIVPVAASPDRQPRRRCCRGEEGCNVQMGPPSVVEVTPMLC